MNKKFFFLLLTIGIVIGHTSCQQGKGKKIPDVSNINVDVDIQQFHQALFSIDTNDIKTGISQLQTDFPSFFDIYFTNVVPFRQQRELSDAFYKNVKGYLTDPGIHWFGHQFPILLNRGYIRM